MDAPAPALSHSAGPFYAREKASPRNMHPDVLAGVDMTNEGNKRKSSERKADVYQPDENSSAIQGGSSRWNMLTILKRRDLPGWADVLFNNGKVDLYDENSESVECSCHREKEHPPPLPPSFDRTTGLFVATAAAAAEVPNGTKQCSS
jgi:hypothetical protein